MAEWCQGEQEENKGMIVEELFGVCADKGDLMGNSSGKGIRNGDAEVFR